MKRSEFDSIIRDGFYPRLKQFIISATGLDYYSDKDNDLASRISRRMAAQRISTCAQYLRLISGEGNEPELDALISELTIGETYFFRHREQFDAIRDIAIPEIMRRNRATKKIRIWSAGCATGAEPYS